jgi:hypothetical protein
MWAATPHVTPQAAVAEGQANVGSNIPTKAESCAFHFMAGNLSKLGNEAVQVG